MEVIKQAFYTVFLTITSLVPALLQGAFGIKDSIDAAKDQYTAAVFGAPVWIITVIGVAGTIISGIILLSRFIDWLKD